MGFKSVLTSAEYAKIFIKKIIVCPSQFRPTSMAVRTVQFLHTRLCVLTPANFVNFVGGCFIHPCEQQLGYTFDHCGQEGKPKSMDFLPILLVFIKY